MKQLVIVSLLTMITFTSVQTLANAAPKVGKKAAAKYFQARNQDYEPGTEPRVEPKPARRNPAQNSEPQDGGLGREDHYLTFGLGTYTQSDVYNWGASGKEENIAKFGVEMSYRLTLAEEGSLFDHSMRVAYNEFKPHDERTSKLSFLYSLTLPDASSQFPLYFGVAAGPGIFLKQIGSESFMSLDYQLFLGIRLFNIYGNTGFYLEGGLRNHVQLFSDGQLNGTFVSAGGVFTF